MEMKITIETWNDVWHFEIEDKEFGERVKWGESDSFTGCAAVCLEFVAENKNAAEQSVHPTLLIEPVNYCNPVNGVHAPFCTGHKSQSG